MHTAAVRFDVDEDVIEYLRRRAIDPEEFARSAFDGAIRRLRMQEKMDRLDKIAFRLPEPAADLVRRERDSH